MPGSVCYRADPHYDHLYFSQHLCDEVTNFVNQLNFHIQSMIATPVYQAFLDIFDLSDWHESLVSHSLDPIKHMLIDGRLDNVYSFKQQITLFKECSALVTNKQLAVLHPKLKELLRNDIVVSKSLFWQPSEACVPLIKSHLPCLLKYASVLRPELFEGFCARMGKYLSYPVDQFLNKAFESMALIALPLINERLFNLRFYGALSKSLLKLLDGFCNKDGLFDSMMDFFACSSALDYKLKTDESNECVNSLYRSFTKEGCHSLHRFLREFDPSDPYHTFDPSDRYDTYTWHLTQLTQLSRSDRRFYALISSLTRDCIARRFGLTQSAQAQDEAHPNVLKFD